MIRVVYSFPTESPSFALRFSVLFGKWVNLGVTESECVLCGAVYGLLRWSYRASHVSTLSR